MNGAWVAEHDPQLGDAGKLAEYTLHPVIYKDSTDNRTLGMLPSDGQFDYDPHESFCQLP